MTQPNDDSEDKTVPNTDNYLDDGELIERPSTDAKKFVPSFARPLPSFPCTAIKKDGTRCENSAIMGMRPDNAKCTSHGGKVPTVKDAAQARVEAARLDMFESLPDAVNTMKSLLEPGVSDAVRLKAATELMDRTMGRAPIELDVTTEITVNTAEEVRNRLAGLIENKIELPAMDEEGIVDAEIVEDEDDER